eukprot:gnl/Chilomastix_caulleri/664.p1 GENE.gnl/Chilomastix_caulleri/664~~gnl/Chilomastix_caulleri/664.p1  ORF type:complete len:166 (+),score=48.40 gnl/Chilomastix_caulleri/664:158-655(+)
MNGERGEKDEEIVSKHPFLIASGTMLSCNVGRQIIKRAVITGGPYKIRNRKVAVREMFGNADDVRYFLNVPLWANKGKRGVIVKPSSDHGNFRARFNRRIFSGDTIAMRLYKRVFPRDGASRELQRYVAAHVRRMRSSGNSIETTNGMGLVDGVLPDLGPKSDKE